MIPLAAIEGKLVFLAVAAVVGVINWLMEKSKKAAEGGQSQPSLRPQQPANNPGGESEQERLRRFLEALGVPQQQPPAQRPQPTAQPATRPTQQISQRTAKPIEGRMQSVRPPQKKPAKNIRPPKRMPVREPEEMTRAGRIEEAATSIENISGEFGAMNVRVAMDPVKPLGSSAHMATGNAGTTSVIERDGSPIAARLRRLLHNPSDLRAAFVATEVLGPPRGLQN